jgi:hypothetical protein
MGRPESETADGPRAFGQGQAQRPATGGDISGSLAPASRAIQDKPCPSAVSLYFDLKMHAS